MYKIHKLSSAEYKKIYSRPSVLLVFLFLAIIVFFSSILFNPKTSIAKQTYSGSSVQKIFDNFKEDNLSLADTNIVLNEAEEKIDKVKNLEDKLTIFKEKLNSCYNYKATLRIAVENLIENNSSENIQKVQESFKKLKNEKIFEVYSYISNSLSSDLNFYMSQVDYDKLKTFFDNFLRDTPDNFTGYVVENYVNRYNILIENYFNFDKKVFPITDTFEKIEIDTVKLDNLKQEYIVNTRTKLQEKYTIIESYYIVNASETDDEYKQTINTYIAEYCSIAKTSSEIIDAELKLNKAGNKTDTFLQNCIDFENFRKYEIQESLNINKYLIENNLYEYDILRNFAFNKQSGYKVNMLDFSFFALQICSIIITLFLIFSISAIIADEQNKGTIKLVAIRPITRNKILAGKYLGAIKSVVFALLVVTVGTLIFGYFNYGLPTTTSAIISINAGPAISINIYALFAIYIFNLIINLFFFGSVAMFIACLTRSNVITIFISSIIYILTIGLVNTFNQFAWTKYLPITNIDLFKYFGNNTTGFLAMNLAPEPSFIFSGIYLLTSIIVLNAISHVIFSSRDLA